jgi:hypothetical protein
LEGLDESLAETMAFTAEEYAALLAVADLDGVTVEQVIADAARKALVQRFSRTRKAGIVLPFPKDSKGALSGPEGRTA